MLEVSPRENHGGVVRVGLRARNVLCHLRTRSNMSQVAALCIRLFLIEEYDAVHTKPTLKKLKSCLLCCWIPPSQLRWWTRGPRAASDALGARDRLDTCLELVVKCREILDCKKDFSLRVGTQMRATRNGPRSAHYASQVLSSTARHLLV